VLRRSRRAVTHCIVAGSLSVAAGYRGWHDRGFSLLSDIRLFVAVTNGTLVSLVVECRLSPPVL
jgi:hypothetical protein